MATALSEDEFHRMQLQLLELRTTNYELDGKCKKFEREASYWQDKYHLLDKDLQRSTKALQKSKKAKDIEEILQEMDALQRKVESQEEDFRLQNQALMNELSILVSSNEELEQKLANVTENGTSPRSKMDIDLQGEITRLRALNAVLQEKVEENSTIAKSPEADAGQVEISDIQMQLKTETAEKQLLREQLDTLQGTVDSQRDDITKLEDKLKKKQESFIQLQGEKEKMYTDSRQQKDELESVRDRDQIYYTEQINKLQQELSRTKQTYEELERTSSAKLSSMQIEFETQQKQNTEANSATHKELKQHTSNIMKQLNDTQLQLGSALKRAEDLNTQLQESKRLNQSSIDQLYAVQQERDVQIQALQEANKVAEKRKSLLDDLAIKSQQDADAHHAKVRQLEATYSSDLEDLQLKWQQEQTRAGELEKLKRVVDELRGQVSSLEETKGWLERRLHEAEEEGASRETEHLASLQQLQDCHDITVDSLKRDHKKEIEEAASCHEVIRADLDAKIEEINSLQQSIKDKDGEKKIHEKKGLTMLKDLKRQLHSERKRAEKLQDRLQEVLSDSKDHNAISELFESTSANNSFHTDGSSVSAWSVATSGSGNKEITNIQSPTQESCTSEEMEKEYNGLLMKIASIQQAKWSLEEKVRHLEGTNSAMAEELLNKTAIIKHYVMDSRPGHQHVTQRDKISLKKVLDIVNKNDDIKEMNHKLQRMLEETLTKNMHIQKDMDMLSEEIVRLSKLLTQNQDIQSGYGTKKITPINQSPNEQPQLRTEAAPNDQALDSEASLQFVKNHVMESNGSDTTTINDACCAGEFSSRDIQFNSISHDFGPQSTRDVLTDSNQSETCVISGKNIPRDSTSVLTNVADSTSEGRIISPATDELESQPTNQEESRDLPDSNDDSCQVTFGSSSLSTRVT